MKTKKKLLLPVLGLLMTFWGANATAASAKPATITWNGLTLDQVLKPNSVWKTESYLNTACEKRDNVEGKIKTEWNCDRSGGKFESHIETEGTNYHCHIKVTGAGVSGTYEVEKQFTIDSKLKTDEKLALISKNCPASSTETCPTLEFVSSDIPDYALSDNGNKVTICHNTSSSTNPFNVITISTNALNTHLENHADYFSKSGACPTDAQPCPPFVCILPLVMNAAKTGCVEQGQPVSPTVNSPTITFGTTTAPFSGNVGTSTTLAITVADTSVSSASITPVTVSGTWTYSATVPSTLSVGSHTVTVTGDSGSAATGTLTVQCPTDKPTWKNNDCVAETGSVPTITSIDGQSYSGVTSIRTGNKKPTITGKLDTGASPKVLNNDSFVVTLEKFDHKTSAYTTVATYDKSMSALTTASGAALGASSTDWKLVIPTDLDPGYKYEIKANRNGTPDSTHDELIVGIAVCDKSVSSTVPSYILYSEGTAIVENSNYYLGQCTPTASKPTFSNALTQELTSDSCVGSKSTSMTIDSAIVTQATIMNVTTTGGTIDTDWKANAAYKYGVKSAGVGSMDISGATIATDGIASGVTLSGVTLTNAYLDPKSGSIDVTGGTVKSSATSSTIAFNSNNTAAKSTITDGIIKEGTNGGKAVRGRIVRGKNDTDISAITNGKRIKGTLTGVTITNVTTTTALDPDDNNLKTFVMPGTTTTIDSGTFVPTETFGNVNNATIPTTGTTTITNATHCFSSGKVGEHGQLNWKEKGQ